MSRKTTLTGAWLRLIEAAGGVGKLAELIKVPPRYITRWGNGANVPTLAHRQALQSVSRRLGVKCPVRVWSPGESGK